MPKPPPDDDDYTSALRRSSSDPAMLSTRVLHKPPLANLSPSHWDGPGLLWTTAGDVLCQIDADGIERGWTLLKTWEESLLSNFAVDLANALPTLQVSGPRSRSSLPVFQLRERIMPSSGLHIGWAARPQTIHILPGDLTRGLLAQPRTAEIGLYGLPRSRRQHFISPLSAYKASRTE